MVHVVVGASGALGHQVVNVLVEEGKKVVGVSRMPLRVDIPMRKVDLKQKAQTFNALRDAQVVYYCVGLQEGSDLDHQTMLDHVIQACRSVNAKLVYVDCIDYYGKIDFTQPIHEHSVPMANTSQARIRQTLVSMVEQSGLAYLIVRTPMLYGPRMVHSPLYPALLAPILAGRSGQFVGKRFTTYPYAYVEDVARAMVLLAGIDALYGQSWHAPIDASISLATIQQVLGTILQRRVKVKTTPALVSKMLGYGLPLLKQAHARRAQFEVDCVWDDALFRHQFPMFETTPFAAGMAAMVDSFTPKR